MDINAAAALVLADTEHPCVFGHFDCATYEGGACSGEAAAAIHARGMSGMDVQEAAEAVPARRYCHWCGEWVGSHGGYHGASVCGRTSPCDRCLIPLVGGYDGQTGQRVETLCVRCRTA
jgi:hypothetical protein